MSQENTMGKKLGKRPQRNQAAATYNSETSPSLSSRIYSSASALTRDAFTNVDPRTSSSAFASAISNGSKGEQSSSSMADPSSHQPQWLETLNTAPSSSTSQTRDPNSLPGPSFRSQPASSNDYINQDFERFLSSRPSFPDEEHDSHSNRLPNESIRTMLQHPGQGNTESPHEKEKGTNGSESPKFRYSWHYQQQNQHLISHQHIQHQQYVIDRHRQKHNHSSPHTIHHQIDPQDGAEVVSLLADPKFSTDEIRSSSFDDAELMELEQDPATIKELFHHNIPKEEVERLRALFPPPPEHKAPEPTNPVNLIPEFGELDGRQDGQLFDDLRGAGSTTRGSSAWTGEFSIQQQRQQLLDAWEGVLTRYTDEVWGDLSPVVKEARQELDQAKRTHTDPMAGKAVKRLGMILAHLW